MYRYDADRFKEILRSHIIKSISADAWRWLEEKAQQTQEGNIAQCGGAFAAMARKAGKKMLTLSAEEAARVDGVIPGLSISHWSTERLCRAFLLLHVDARDQQKYVATIENLFKGAEMNEQVALYGALSLYAYPDLWTFRCAEGIRSNIGTVLEAIMCDNPYPSAYLDQPSWNQMVLKAFFTEKPVHRIVGLDKRRNAELARILSDYAHERWAAHRPVHPQLWRCVAPYINDSIFQDIRRMAFSENSVEREAAVLACLESDYPPAKELVRNTSHLKSIAEDISLSWETLAKKASLF